jgi:hypothetical protein
VCGREWRREAGTTEVRLAQAGTAAESSRPPLPAAAADSAARRVIRGSALIGGGGYLPDHERL